MFVKVELVKTRRIKQSEKAPSFSIFDLSPMKLIDSFGFESSIDNSTGFVNDEISFELTCRTIKLFDRSNETILFFELSSDADEIVDLVSVEPHGGDLLVSLNKTASSRLLAFSCSSFDFRTISVDVPPMNFFRFDRLKFARRGRRFVSIGFVVARDLNPTVRCYSV